MLFFIMRVIRIGEGYSISTDEVETYDLLPVYGESEKIIEFAGCVNLNYDCLRAITFELNQDSTFAEEIVELNILNVDLEEYDVYLCFKNGEVFHRYNYQTNLYEERGYDWISMQTKQ